MRSTTYTAVEASPGRQSSATAGRNHQSWVLGDRAPQLGPNPRVTVVFGGDVIPHTPVRDAIRSAGKRDPEQMAALWAEVLAPLKPAFGAAASTAI